MSAYRKIAKVAEGFDVAPLLWALQTHANLWNQYPSRTESTQSPHHEVDDIWVRYAKPEEAAKGEPHDAIWYPCIEVLPVKPLVYQLMQFVEGDRLGGVLITRIRAGKECKPHFDNGWHAKFYQKFAVQVQSAPRQFFCFDDQQLEARPGDVYWFDNAHTHWVPNRTEHDRITMIVCIKTDKEGW